MPAMQMSAAVSDAKMLDAVKIGDKVEFDFEDADSKTVITKLNKIGEVAQINGGEIYKANCSECHGGLGEGASKGISLLKGHALKHSESEYVEQVKNGEGKKMPAFKEKLSPEQITAVVKYVREELQKDVPKEEITDHKH
jgi:mono/diheme cytochrome c family protein